MVLTVDGLQALFSWLRSGQLGLLQYTLFQHEIATQDEIHRIMNECKWIMNWYDWVRITLKKWIMLAHAAHVVRQTSGVLQFKSSAGMDSARPDDLQRCESLTRIDQSMQTPPQIHRGVTWCDNKYLVLDGIRLFFQEDHTCKNLMDGGRWEVNSTP